ncbi:MAG: hypothetical protein IJ262_01140 [Clostridia bacterium]|nr:hypothetical protein [Clostridia bacterium]
MKKDYLKANEKDFFSSDTGIFFDLKKPKGQTLSHKNREKIFFKIFEKTQKTEKNNEN